MKELCKYGASTYYLFDDGSVRVGVTPENARMVYTVTPIKPGYREFMHPDLFQAMEANGLILSQPESLILKFVGTRVGKKTELLDIIGGCTKISMSNITLWLDKMLAQKTLVRVDFAPDGKDGQHSYELPENVTDIKDIVKDRCIKRGDRVQMFNGKELIPWCIGTVVRWEKKNMWMVELDKNLQPPELSNHWVPLEIVPCITYWRIVEPIIIDKRFKKSLSDRFDLRRVKLAKSINKQYKIEISCPFCKEFLTVAYTCDHCPFDHLRRYGENYSMVGCHVFMKDILLRKFDQSVVNVFLDCLNAIHYILWHSCHDSIMREMISFLRKEAKKEFIFK